MSCVVGVVAAMRFSLCQILGPGPQGHQEAFSAFLSRADLAQVAFYKDHSDSCVVDSVDARDRPEEANAPREEKVCLQPLVISVGSRPLDTPCGRLLMILNPFHRGSDWDPERESHVSR